MNTIRLIAISLPMTLLLACGGGGGGGATPTTMMPGTGDPNMPPANPLTVFMPTEGSATIQAVQEIIGTDGVALSVGSAYAEGALFSTHTISCPVVCLIDLPSIGNTGFDLTNDTPNLSFVNDNLDNANSQITNSQTVNGVALVQGSITGMKNNIPVEFHTFAGWLDGSIFGVTRISIGSSGSEEYRFAPYNVGASIDSRPEPRESETSATWSGIAVASIKVDRTFIRGDATIDIDDLSSPDIDLEFDNWHDINGQAISGVSAITYSDLGLNLFGVFSGNFMDDEEVAGRFYGTNHNEVGGNFNTETVTGSFAGIRQ